MTEIVSTRVPEDMAKDIEENEKGIILKPLPSPRDDFGSLKTVFKGKTSQELVKE